MVKETRIVVNPGDVLCVRVKCPKCTNAIVLRLETDEVTLRDRCPICDHLWGVSQGERKAIDLGTVQNLLSNLRRLARNDAMYVELEFKDTDAK